MTTKLTDLKVGDILVYAAGDHSKWTVTTTPMHDWSIIEVVEEIGGDFTVGYVSQHELSDGTWVLDTDSLFYKQLVDL